MRKLLLLSLLGLALIWWLGRGRRRPSDRPADRAAPSAGRSGQGQAPQAMLSCCRCGLHLPRDDAFLDDRGRAYCGLEHRRLGPGAGSSS